MLEPREADIPALFLVLVVLPLVTYILLGKWSEAAKRKERISLLAQIAAEEALQAEAISDASVISVVSSSKNGLHECARCFGPATTRCSRCKSVRYCSGKCQIIHWRQGHKQECQQLETTCSNSSPEPASIDESFHERVLLNDSMNSQFFEYNVKQSRRNSAPSDKTLHPHIITAASTTIDTTQVSTLEKRPKNKRVSCKFNREMLNREDGTLSGSSEQTYRSRVTSPTLSNVIPSKEASIGHKLGSHDSIALEEQISKKHYIDSPTAFVRGHTAPRSTMHESHNLRGQNGSLFESRRDSSIPSSLLSAKNGANRCEMKTDFTLDKGNFLREGFSSYGETVDLNSSPERISVKGGIKSTSTLHPPETKISSSSRSTVKALREYSRSGVEMNGQMANESKVPRVHTSATIPAQGSCGVSNTGVMKMMGLRKLPKLPRQDASGVTSENRKKNKVLFPYEEFVKFFQCEVWDLSPRGLLNCGNSCYANAVLQCLTCTKPLIIYLLRREHSRTCCVKDWCLMCELEQHVMMLREGGGPLSPSRILSHMRKIGCQMGGGSQEDAHEFLRLLVTSMQYICLERLGGEKEVDSRLQETTFIQHTFGGRLRSTVKCLRCHHESERYENFMDLTLEILGWVESLEDALTQFTAPEDLDGENMYRCGRCAAYVQARKQLSIHEAPNILTVVLKRFQKGRYGKINKCITFPDMLDMIPFMTGTDDIPSLYMLYAVVVHLDALNESFSGHYVSYVKDLKDMWFRIDDTQVHPVPLSQVMSEGAYILFYSRSSARPPKACNGRATLLQAPASARHCASKPQKSSRPGQSKPSGYSFGPEDQSDPRPPMNVGTTNQTSNSIHRSENRNILPMAETYAESLSTEFSDATSSDWSLFTSSDEASFTTESTRDSFSTVDYADTFNVDPISSIFNNLYAPEYSSHNTVSCRRFSFSKPHIRFLSEEKGFVLDSSLSTQPLDSVQNGENLKQKEEKEEENEEQEPWIKAFLSHAPKGFCPSFWVIFVPQRYPQLHRLLLRLLDHEALEIKTHLHQPLYLHCSLLNKDLYGVSIVFVALS